MVVPLAGLIMEPMDGGKRTRVCFIAEGGLGGSIPDFVTKQVIAIQAYTMIQLRKFCGEFRAKFKGEYPLLCQQEELL